MNDFDFHSTLSEWHDAIRVRELFLCLSGPALRCAQLSFTTVTGEDGTQRKHYSWTNVKNALNTRFICQNDFIDIQYQFMKSRCERIKVLNLLNDIC